MMTLKQVTIILLACVAGAVALNYNPEEFKPEKSYCPPIVPDPNLNEKWLRTVDYWYLPKGSMRDYYLGLKMFTTASEFKALSTQTVQGSCFMMTHFGEESGAVDLYGANRKLAGLTLSYRPMRKGILDFFYNGEYSFTSYTVLTDNKSYRLQIDENREGNRDFRIAATSDNISVQDWEKIYKKLEFYGFKRSEAYSVKSICVSDPYMQQVKEAAASSPRGSGVSPRDPSVSGSMTASRDAPAAPINSYARGGAAASAAASSTYGPGAGSAAAASSYARG